MSTRPSFSLIPTLEDIVGFTCNVTMNIINVVPTMSLSSNFNEINSLISSSLCIILHKTPGYLKTEQQSVRLPPQSTVSKDCSIEQHPCCCRNTEHLAIGLPTSCSLRIIQSTWRIFGSLTRSTFYCSSKLNLLKSVLH